MLAYREHSKPSETLPEPYAILATAAIAAGSDIFSFALPKAQP